MAVLKILLLIVIVQLVHSKPFLFKDVTLKKNFELSLKPVLKPLAIIKEWVPLVPVKEHKVAKRSPPPPPTEKPEPPPEPFLKIGLEKSLEIKSPFSPPPPPKEEPKEPPPVLPLVHPKVFGLIHEEHIHDAPKPAPKGKLPPVVEVHEIRVPPHARLPPVSPLPPPYHVWEPSPPESSPPPVDVHIPYIARHEHHLLVEPKPKLPEHEKINEGPIFGISKSSSIIRGHPPPPPPPRIEKITPSAPKEEGTLDAFFTPGHAIIEEEPEHSPVPYHHAPVPHHVSGQGSIPVPEFLRPPPPEIQEQPPPNPLFTDIARAEEINAYLKAIDALPLLKPPLEELLVPNNSVEPPPPKNPTAEKTEPSSLAKGSRLALYFGNILLQVMSQAIGSARSAIGQYSMPAMF